MSVVGSAIARLLLPGDVVLLNGDLGSGKTTLTKFVAAALGVTEPVTSPTFTIAHEYSCGPGPTVRRLVHLDAYRLRSADDLEAVGLFDALDDGAASVIEWGDVVASAVPDALRVELAFVDDEHRSIFFTVVPDTGWSDRFDELRAAIGASAC